MGNEGSRRSPVAIIGMACRFPDAENLQAFWDLLKQGKSHLPKSTNARLPSVGKLENVRAFDAEFFNISPREAHLMDPQQRFCLEVSWEALSDAGVTKDEVGKKDNNHSVFVATQHSDYNALMAEQVPDLDVIGISGGSRNAISGHVSQFFNMQGTSLTLDSDRSSSLVAVHMACQGLQNGDTDLALVCGVNLILLDNVTAAFKESGMLSADGFCKFGDGAADGFARSEGVAAVVLKRLDEAVRDGNHIYATIMGSKVVHVGQGTGDFMVPNLDAQKNLFIKTCEQGAVKASDVFYVEAHGTGTPMGDKVELLAVDAVYGKSAQIKSKRLVGSVKTNIGHTESAAGLAGLIKSALILKNRFLPKSLHFRAFSQELTAQIQNLEIPTQGTAIPAEETGFVAVSSFGLTGTLAHALLAFPPSQNIRVKAVPNHVWNRKEFWFTQAINSGGKTSNDEPSRLLIKQIVEAPIEVRSRIITDILQKEISTVLENAEPGGFNPGTPLRELGLRSLVAIELKDRLSKLFDLSLPSTLTFNYPTISSLAEFLSQAILAKHQNLFQTLIRNQRLTPSDLSDAVEHQSKAPGQRLGSILIQSGKITSNELNSVLSAQMSEPMAVIGMSCRLPGQANTPEQLWKNLCGEKNSITEISQDRWSYTGKDTRHVIRGGFLDSVDKFDAEFFGIAPREADSIDPQQRLLLELTWEALENAGLAPAKLRGTKTSVYVGMMNFTDYAELKQLQAAEASISAYESTGDANSIASGRLAYFLDTRGAAVTIDTACSSSLVALHLAAQGIRSGEAEVSVVAGVNLILSPTRSLCYAQAKMLSPSAQCNTFDADADGYVRGEGGSVVIIKRLSHAIRDRDNILAVIAGSAINQDGRTSGLTAPNGLAQKMVIREALSLAGIQPESVNYVEAHGTGTPLGDPIEIESLATVYGEGRTAENRLLVGSIKTNIGHLEAAAGLAGLVKVILSMAHGKIPKHLNLKKLNPKIAEVANNVEFPSELRAWPAGTEKIAGISSFGFSGTNAHIIVKEPPPSAPATTLSPVGEIFCLSARSDAALTSLAEKYLDLFNRNPSQSLHNLCYTANVGRTHFHHRLALYGSSVDTLALQLKEFLADRSGSCYGKIKANQTQPLSLVFDARGIPHRLLKELYDSESTFRDSVDQQLQGFRAKWNVDLIQEVVEMKIPNKEFAHWSTFIQQWALFQLLKSWDLSIGNITGYGVGDLTAAAASGAISLAHAEHILNSWTSAELGNEARETWSKSILEPRPLYKFLPAQAPAFSSEYLKKWEVPPSPKESPSETVKNIFQSPDGLTLLFNSHTVITKKNVIYLINENEKDSWLPMLGQLYVHGVSLDWNKVYRNKQSNKVQLVNYPFERKTHWLGKQIAKTSSTPNNVVPLSQNVPKPIELADNEIAQMLRKKKKGPAAS